ncbi:phage tail sheath family protein [Clostridium sp. AF18-27]|uniref:phage tail sheath family protein n=1 Tax=Enterocloster lavalensis TaxID=460384 RepID=UPI000E4C1D2E|nr:phage tail sheath family protein [Enterocloster lavalensis]RHR51973.1 phage tail sheath family protein [Clostridium sp. AF18-27]
MAYKHGIEIIEKATSFPSPTATRHGVQVVFGTAPVNLAQNPAAAANRPIKVSTFEEAEKALGYSDDWENYTLCQSMYASFKLFQIEPVIFINVLDPQNHVKDLTEKAYEVNNHQVTIESAGILADTITVLGQTGNSGAGLATAGESSAAGENVPLTKGTDYITRFDEFGYLSIALLSTGLAYQSAELTVSGKMLDPEMVTEADMIGAYNAETGTETGMEVLRQVYPKYGVAPGILLAPGWSEKPNIGAALQGKCEDINGAFRAMCLLDLDTEQAKKHTDCAKVKREMGYDEAHSIVLWPRVTSGGKEFCYSAVYGAMMSYNTAANNDVPYLYPSNKELNVDGAVRADGTEILLDQVQAGILNGDGIVTAFCDLAWKSYGNNTGCYPENTDPKDRWIGCRRMFDYVANYFVVEYRKRLDSNMNRRTVDDIVNNFNIWGNSLVAAGMCAGLYAEYRTEENTTDDVLNGHMKLRIYFAPYTPVEYINALMEFDIATLESVMAEEG